MPPIRKHHPDCARHKLPARIYCTCGLEHESEANEIQLTETFEHRVPTEGGGTVLYKTVHTYNVDKDLDIRVIIDGRWHDDDTIRHAEVIITGKEMGRKGELVDFRRGVCDINMRELGFGSVSKLRKVEINWSAWGATPYDDMITWHGAMGIALYWAQLWNTECKFIAEAVEKEEADAANVEDAAVPGA